LFIEEGNMPDYTIIPDMAAEVKELQPGSILSRGLLNTDKVKVTIFGFDAGQELTEHTAAYPAILHFLEGEADLTLGADGYQARAGTWVHMRARLPHSLQARTPVKMLLLMLVGEE